MSLKYTKKYSEVKLLTRDFFSSATRMWIVLAIHFRASQSVMYYVRPFPGLSSSFFFFIWKRNSEEGSRQIVTEEPKKGLKTCQAP